MVGSQMGCWRSIYEAIRTRSIATDARAGTFDFTALTDFPVSTAFVRRLAKPQDASACHILFISGSRAHELNQILSSIDEAAVLTVSDMPDFSKRGGMIQFVLEGDRIRFEINLAGAEKSHLVFPSELLKVATAVRKPARSGD